jgi:GT2 family glycosyltransferase
MKVSVVMTSWNVSSFVRDALDSLRGQSFNDFEIIIVDNGSEDGSIEIFERDYPEARLIKNNENLGFSRATNQGIDIAQGEYILTLNADVILTPSFLSEMVKKADEAGENYGMFNGKMLRFDGRTIDSLGLVLSHARRFYDRGGGEIDAGQYDEPAEVFGVCAGAALYRRPMLEEISYNGEYFDESFFFLAEDFDIAWRSQLAGYRALYIPQAVCYHLRGGCSALRQYHSFKNRYLLMIKNDSLKNILLDAYYLIPYDLARFFYLLITNRLVIKALYQIKKLIPELKEKRAFIKEKTKVSESYIRGWLGKGEIPYHK